MSFFDMILVFFPLLLDLSYEPTSFEKCANGTFEGSKRHSIQNILLTAHFGKYNFDITVVKIKTEWKSNQFNRFILEAKMSRFGPDFCLFPLLLALSTEPTSFDKCANGTFEGSRRPSKPNILLTAQFGKSNFDLTVVKI